MDKNNRATHRCTPNTVLSLMVSRKHVNPSAGIQQTLPFKVLLDCPRIVSGELTYSNALTVGYKYPVPNEEARDCFTPQYLYLCYQLNSLLRLHSLKLTQYVTNRTLPLKVVCPNTVGSKITLTLFVTRLF